MRHVVRATLSLVLAAAAVRVQAAEWHNVPDVALGAGSDSNVRLTAEDERYVANSSLTVSTDVVGRDDGFDFRFRPQLRSIRYDDPREIDRDDAFASTNLVLGNARRSWSLGANYSRESTLTSEFGRFGFVEVDIQRKQSSLDTGWTHRAGDRGTVGLTALATDVDYGEAFLSPLVDYGYRVAQISYSLAANERSNIGFTTSRSRVTTLGRDTHTDSRGFNVRWVRRVSSALRSTVGVGAFEVVSSGPFGAETTNASLTLGVDGNWSRWTLRASGERDLIPDGTGTLVREDALELAVGRRLTERVTLDFELRGARIAAQGTSRDLPERDYAQASLALQWRPAQRWSVYVALLDRVQEVDVARADGRQGVFSVRYRGG
jgi:hypothetical protein